MSNEYVPDRQKQTENTPSRHQKLSNCTIQRNNSTYTEYKAKLNTEEIEQ